MHDLLRAYACEQAAAGDDGGQRNQALQRLSDYYLAAAAAAMDALFPAEAHVRPRVAARPAVVPDIAGEADARAWLDAELANLVAVVVHCANHGRPGHVAGLAGTLFRYLMSGSHLTDALTIYNHALVVARRSGDLVAQAEALNGLGSVAGKQGRFSDAADHYLPALVCYQSCGDRAGQAGVLNNLGITQERLHDHRSAVAYHREAIVTYQEAGDRFGAARALAELAFAETTLELYDDAAEHLHQALQVFRDSGDRVREAQALSRLGEIRLRRSQLTSAAGCFEQALAIFCSSGSPMGMAAQLGNLGDVSLRQGNYLQAISYERRALEQFRQAGDQYSEVLALRILAKALHGTGQSAAARSELETAVRLAAETGDRYQEAGVHGDLADSHDSAGHVEHAWYHWEQALHLYSQLRAPEAGEIRSHLRRSKAATQHAHLPGEADLGRGRAAGPVGVHGEECHQLAGFAQPAADFLAGRGDPQWPEHGQLDRPGGIRRRGLTVCGTGRSVRCRFRRGDRPRPGVHILRFCDPEQQIASRYAQYM
jgi:tetratricopeptide (TPR) repeat protein